MLGLPDGITACLFDLDGVLTKTAEVHAHAWKQIFDAFLKTRGEQPFDLVHDYDEYVDGKPRLDGVRDFLASRGIELPAGAADDPPDAETIQGLANAKNELVLRLIRERGGRGLRGLGALPARRARRRPAPGRRLLEPQLPGRAGGRRDRGSARGARRRRRRRGAPPARQAGPRHLPGGGEDARRRPRAGRGVRGRAGRRAGRAARAASVTSSASTAPASARRCSPTAPRWWSTTSPSCCDRPSALLGRAVGGHRGGSSTSACWRRPSRSSRSPTATSGCAPTSTRASPTACRARTSTPSTRSARCPTRRPATAIPRRARPSSTSPTAS